MTETSFEEGFWRYTVIQKFARRKPTVGFSQTANRTMDLRCGFLTRPTNGSTPCTPGAPRPLHWSERPGPLVTHRPSSGCAAFRKTQTKFGLPSFESVPVRIFFQLLFQKLLHPFVRLAEKAIVRVASRRFVRRQTRGHFDQHGVGVRLVQAERHD